MTTDNKKANPVDVYVGKRITLRRKALNLTQSELAKKMGVTFQQIQKYEKGYNRIGASRLWDISKILGVSVDFFFAGIETQIMKWNNCKKIDIVDPMTQSETIELVNSYYLIKNRKVAKDLFSLLHNLADSKKST